MTLMIPAGRRYGNWTVATDFEGVSRDKVLCRCDCGTERPVIVANLRQGLSSGCGCVKDRKTGDRFRKHGVGYEDYRYRAWRTIKGKCFCPTHKDWNCYGGRGIGLYEPWVDNFAAFAAYLDHELGPRPDGYTLDRIDNGGDYVPGNLRWATRSEQALNRRNRWRFRKE